MTADSVSPFAATIPESLFMLYPMTFAQLLAQPYGVVATALWSGVMTVVILKVIALLVPLRAKREDESWASTSASTAKRCNSGIYRPNGRCQSGAVGD